MNASRKFMKAQLVDQPMESRIARLESDVGHIKADIVDIKLDIRKLDGKIDAANENIALLQKDVGVLVATVANMAKTAESHFATKAELKAMETTMIRWFVGTAIALTTLAFAIARFVELPARPTENPTAASASTDPVAASDTLLPEAAVASNRASGF